MATETGDGTADTGESAVEGSVTEESSGWSDYTRKVSVTTVATLTGMAAGIASSQFATSAGDRTALLILATAVIIQFPLYRLLGMDMDEFGAKSKLYVTFMTFVLWFISWGVLLTTGAIQ
jgi:hypothetical protein